MLQVSFILRDKSALLTFLRPNFAGLTLWSNVHANTLGGNGFKKLVIFGCDNVTKYIFNSRHSLHSGNMDFELFFGVVHLNVLGVVSHECPSRSED